MQLDIRRKFNTKISKSSVNNLKYGADSDYEGTAALIVLIGKKTPEFLAEIQAVIDNNPSNSIRFIAKDMGVSEFLSWQIMHEDIHYFTYKMRKSQFLSQALNDKSKDYAAKFFNKRKHPLQSNMLWFFCSG